MSKHENDTLPQNTSKRNIEPHTQIESDKQRLSVGYNGRARMIESKPYGGSATPERGVGVIKGAPHQSEASSSWGAGLASSEGHRAPPIAMRWCSVAHVPLCKWMHGFCFLGYVVGWVFLNVVFEFLCVVMFFGFLNGVFWMFFYN